MPQSATQGLSSAMQARMSYLIERQGVISGNIANAATPNYIAKDLTFSGKLENAMTLQKTDSQHFAPNRSTVHGAITEDTRNMKINGNSVDTTTEMLKLNEVQTEYTLMTKLRAKHVQMYRLALGQQ